MEGAASTDQLSALAPKWSLAGDDHLLSLLQNTHQKIISKCQDVSSKLEEMTSALDDASISLQNVNNKFMALSNSQFIESRVYDDEEVTETQPVKETPQPTPEDHTTALKNSLLVLERAHDATEIMDESDSDSDTEISVVLKPKDKYSHRPLPHVIGTAAWKNKWHAGLIVEDSDADSSTSKHSDVEMYSDSEEEDAPAPERIREHTISETSSSLPSDRPTIPTPPPQRPADIAAELARRLGGGKQIIEQAAQEYTAPTPTTRKVYKPEQPAASTIFSDEPPPLPEDTYEPDTQSEDEDIFAEINKRKPYTQRSTVQPNLAEDLFSFDKPVMDQGDIFSDSAPTRYVDTKPSAKPKSTLFQDESEPELFAEPPKKEVHQNNNISKEPEISTKKPVGGISLFGNNKGAERIGAAILKRNQRKSSSSGDESEELPKNIENLETLAKSNTFDKTDDQIKKEKDIFDDLFAKSDVKQKKPAQNVVKKPVKDKEKNPVKDIFSDNIFDDIDDIFTSNIKIPPKGSNQKSIFDEDDDLFSDIAKPKPIVNRATSSKNDKTGNSKEKKSIFDSDDDLFSDVKPTDTISTKNIESQETKVTKNDQKVSNDENIRKLTATTKERNLFDDSPQNIPKPEVKQPFKTKGIFDSDSDDEDIFATVKKLDKTPNKTENVLNFDKDVYSNEKSKLDHNPNLLTTETESKSNTFQSPSLFEEDEIDDLFINANKIKAAENLLKETRIAEVKNIPSVTKDLEIANTVNAKDTVTVKDTVIVKDTMIVKDTVIENDALVVKETVTTKNTTTTVNKTTLPVDNSFIETKQTFTEKSVSFPKQISDADISDDNLLEDDLFSPAKVLNEPSKNTSKDIITTEIIASSQEVNESPKDETKGYFKEKIVKAKPNFEDISDDVRETKIKSEEKDLNESIFDDFAVPVKEKETLIEHKKPVSNDIFDDIFTEPPAFEKPAESKKSKNVNALFDDDSDDESMFFKKNDVISDDKPELFSNNANFGIFVDEPPAIDVDFAAKAAQNENLCDDDEDIFSSLPKMEENKPKSAQNLNLFDNDEDLFEETATRNVIPETKITSTADTIKVTNVSEGKANDNSRTEDVEKNLFSTPDIEKQITADKIEEKVTNTIGKEVIDSDDDLFSTLPKPNMPKSSQKDEDNKSSKPNPVESQKLVDEYDDIFKPKESPKKEETKKIGKLNTKNFNINVNALIPGASPKKVPKEPKNEENVAQEPDTPKMVKIFLDETDFQPKPQSNKTEKERIDSNKIDIEPNTKTVAFEEKADSKVLDNKASKQRARIQVKRRPSSRRARHEAVRKSAIDLYDDTDNSSSFDEPVKSKSKDSESVKPVEKESDILNQNDPKVEQPSDTQKAENAVEVSNETSKNADTKSILDTAKDRNDQIEVVPTISSEIDGKTKQNVNEQKTSTTKVVYILNDEDIFDTGPKNTEKETDSVFGTKNTETKDSEDLFGTNTKTENDDLFETKNVEIKDNDDVFGSRKIVTKEKDDVFGTNNEDDIFKSIQGVKTLGKTYKEHAKEPTEVKTDENVFKTATAIIKNDENTIKEVTSSKNAKTLLFEDSDEELFNKKKNLPKKTTIFDSESEEDLFSGKKTEKQNKEKKNQEVKERKEVVVKKSLFGDEDDDDLFGSKMEKPEPKIQSSKQSTSKETIASKTSEAVFNDPLSMLGDDD